MQIKNQNAGTTKLPKELLLDYYLKILEILEIEPNFWCSREYFNKAKWEVISQHGWIWIIEEDMMILPPLLLFRNNPEYCPFPCPTFNKEHWCDFYDYEIDYFPHKKFLDYEYIFDPKSFLSMDGGKWKVFRKNSRKWYKANFPVKHHNYQLNYLSIPPFSVKLKITQLFTHWLSGKSQVIEDSDVMYKFLYGGENRKVLTNSKGEIVGMNVWDENYKYINYRYCICKQEPWLSEYMRWLFYTDPEIIQKNKLVNDGGTLGCESLKSFKDKMNPVRVREVNTRY